MNDRDDVRDDVGKFSADAAMYDGQQLPDGFFDSIDDSSGLRREIEVLQQQLVESKQTALALGDMTIGRFGLTATGLIAPDDATIEEFGILGQTLFRLEGSLQWLIGDWLLLVDGYHWGDAGALAAHFGRKAQSLYNMKLVAKNVQFSLRRENLSYGHHVLVQAMDEADQVYWLDKAEYGDVDPTDKDVRIRWSVARLRNEIKLSRKFVALPAESRIDFMAKAKEIKDCGRAFAKAGHGDEGARRDVLEWVVEHRRWLDEMVRALEFGDTDYV